MWCDQEDAAGPSDPQAPGAGKGKAGSAKEITARPTASPRLVELVQVKTAEGFNRLLPPQVCWLLGVVGASLSLSLFLSASFARGVTAGLWLDLGIGTEQSHSHFW